MQDLHTCSSEGNDIPPFAEDVWQVEVEDVKVDEDDDEDEDGAEEVHVADDVAKVTPLDAVLDTPAPPPASLSQSQSPTLGPCHATPTNTLEGTEDFLKRSWTVIPHSLSQ